MVHVRENILYIDLNLLSKYRTPLIGLAALMIIFCHAPYYGVTMPSVVREVLGKLGCRHFPFPFRNGVLVFLVKRCVFEAVVL